jgi:hypothetical protein
MEERICSRWVRVGSAVGSSWNVIIGGLEERVAVKVPSSIYNEDISMIRKL